MTRVKLLTIFLLVLLVSIAVPANKVVSGQRPLVQSIAGIRIGPHASNDEDVKKIFGEGLFAADEGHAGGRYYTDKNRQVTLHVELGVDRIVDTIEFTKGLAVPKKLNSSNPKFVSIHLVNSPTIDKNLSLGMSPDTVIGILGKPDKDIKNGNKRTIIYEIGYDEKDSRVSIYYEANFKFVDGQLVQIRIYDGE